METETNYSELEQKVIKKGRTSFMTELQEASKPMLEVLRKHNVVHSHELLKKITLCYPYNNDGYYQYAVNIPHDKLQCLDSIILDLFMKEITELKQRVDDIEI